MPLPGEAGPSLHPRSAARGPPPVPTSCACPVISRPLHRLRDLGYVEGQNLSIAFRTGEGKAERYPALVAELIDLHVDVLLVMGSEAPLRAARDTTSTIPIVMVAIAYDPMARGYIAGLPRPGGNITGLFFQPLELTGKRLEILKDVLPQLARVAVFWDAFSADQLPAAEAVAREVGVQLQPMELRHPPYDYASAFSAAAEGRAEALLPLMSPVFFRERARLLELVGTHRLPAIFGQRELRRRGGSWPWWTRALQIKLRVCPMDRCKASPLQQTAEYDPRTVEFAYDLRLHEAGMISLPPRAPLLRGLTALLQVTSKKEREGDKRRQGRGQW